MHIGQNFVEASSEQEARRKEIEIVIKNMEERCGTALSQELYERVRTNTETTVGIVPDDVMGMFVKHAQKRGLISAEPLPEDE